MWWRPCIPSIRVTATATGGAERGRASGAVESQRRHALTHNRIGDRGLQRPRRLPLAGRAHLARRAHLIDAPVDFQVVAVRVAKLDGELAAGTAATLEDDRNVVLAQPRASAKHVVRRADLEGEVVERRALELRRAADK